MKAFFFAALIIACATAQTVTTVPGALLGTWNYQSELGTCSGCTYQTLNFAAASNNTITLTVAAQGPCAGTFALQDVVANETLTPNTIEVISLSDASDSFFSVSVSQTDDIGLTLAFTQGLSACVASFSKSANIMKATVGAIIAAAAMLF